MELGKKEVQHMRAIIYTRVSSEEQIKNYSLDTQEKACKEFCERQDWEIVKVFREEGESAKTTDRPKLMELLKYCAENKGKIDVLLVYNLDRFSRNVADHQVVRAMLLRHNVALRSVNQKIDDTPYGKMTENLFALLAQFDNDVRADRSKTGLKERVRQGLWAWGAPLGYKNTPDGLIPDEKAKFIKKAFEVYAQGNINIKQLATKLNKWGLKTKEGKKVLPQTVAKILVHKLYMGVIEVKKWGYEGSATHQSLVSPELFQRVQMIKEGKGRIPVPRLTNNSEFPLKNVIYCLDCRSLLTGSKSTGRKGKRYPYYHCKKCGKTNIKKKLLEDIFFYKLKEIQPNPETKKLFTAVLIDVFKNKTAEAEYLVDKTDKELAALKNKKNLIIEKNVLSIIPDEDCKEQLNIIKDQIVVKELERSEARENNASLDHLLSISENILSNLALLWFEAPFEYKQRFQQLVFPKGAFINEGKVGTDTLGLPFALIQSEALTKTTLVR